MALWQEIKIEPQDKKLLIAFGGTGLVIMALGGVFALLMLLVRTPALSILPSGIFYQALTGHGIMMFIFWLGFIQTAFLIAAGTVLIRQKLWSYRLAWLGYGIMVLAALFALTGILRGANVTYHAAVPLARQFSGAWLIYLSFFTLAAGMSFVVVDFIMTILSAIENKFSLRAWATFFKGLPISTFAAIAGLFIAIPGLIAAMKVFGTAFFWSLGMVEVLPGAFRMHWHIAFHIYHYMPALALVGVAYVLVEATADARSVYAKQVAKALFLLYPIFVPPTFVYHLLMDPNLAYNVKFTGTSLSLLVGVPTVLHTFIILGMLEARMRGAGYSFFGWLKHLPWGNPAFGSMIVGMVTLFTGGLLSYMLIQEQLAPLLHNTFAVPAYIHPMAAGGANITYMGALYYGVPVLLGRQLWGFGLARIQPYLMGGALLIMSIFGTSAGFAGVPRRYPAVGGGTPETWSTLMNLSLGIGGMLALIAGIIFVLVMAMTIFTGKKAATIEQSIKGLESPSLPFKVTYNRTPVALLPAAIFVISVIIFTLFTFGYFWAMPIQMR